MTPTTRPVTRPAGLCTAHALIAWLAALFIAWGGLAEVDYAYGLWYEVLDIGAAIDRYGPENRYRRGFEHTTREERLRLFAAIVEAVHHTPTTLPEIRYHDATGKHLGTLLRAPEIGHLEDVARLLALLRVLGWMALVGYGVVVLVGLRTAGLSSPWQSARQLLLVLVVALTAVLLIGPKRVFYIMHEWVFPPDHPWFFYYQESLMTTLMKAPDLFGAIAVALLLLSLPVVAVLWLLPWWWQQWQAQSGN